MNRENRNARPCPACGGRSYARGRVVGQGLGFTADGASFWRRFMAGCRRGLPARRCDGCGLLQIFSDPDWSRMARPARDDEADFS